jgi:hypothetical protein
VGEIRYSIYKSVLGEGRIERRLEYLKSDEAKQFWACENGRYRQRGELFRMLHE